MNTTQSPPSPELFFETITGYQKAAVLKAGLDLNVFTALADGAAGATELAKKCGTTERGMRILCDNLVVQGFLTKTGDKYSLTQDSSIFLSRKSPAYLGGATDFLLSDPLTDAFGAFTEAVRRGGTATSQEGTVEDNHPIWISFARAMGGMMVPADREESARRLL